MVLQHEPPQEFQTPGVRLHIAGRWSAEEMAHELFALDYLYNVACLTQLSEPNIPSRVPGGFPIGTIFARAHLLSPGSPYRQALIQYLTNLRWAPILDATVTRRCTVRAIEYASPGFQDLAGIAAGFWVILEAVQYYCDRKRRQEKHDAEMVSMRLQQEHMQLENAQLFLKFMKEARFSAKERRQALLVWTDRQTLLWSLIEQRKIRAIDDNT